MKTNLNLTLAAILGFVTGGVAGILLQGAVTTADSAEGNITKVSKFRRNAESPEMSAFQEMITSNPDELKKATVSLSILTSRMAEFDELVTLASIVSDGNEELASSLQNIRDAKRLASNAHDNGILALEALNAIAERKKSSIDYEQAAQNLSLAFMMVDRKLAVGKQYVCDVDSFLRGKNVEEYKDLAFVRDLWAGYCAGGAALNANKEEIAYWQKKQSLLSEDATTLSLTEVGISKLESYDFTHLQECLNIDATIGLHDSYVKIGDCDSLPTLASNEAQNLIMNCRESFKALENLDGFRDMLNLSYGPMVALNATQLILNSTPMPQTRVHILLP